MRLLYASALLAVFVMLSACSYPGTGASPRVSVDAAPAWARHQDSLDALVRRIKTEWYRNITMDKVRAPTGTTVTIQIRFYADGGESVPISIAGGDRKAQRACAGALMKANETWPPELIQSLGDYQTLTFTFVYP